MIVNVLLAFGFAVILSNVLLTRAFIRALRRRR